MSLMELPCGHSLMSKHIQCSSPVFHPFPQPQLVSVTCRHTFRTIAHSNAVNAWTSVVVREPAKMSPHFFIGHVTDIDHIIIHVITSVGRPIGRTIISCLRASEMVLVCLLARTKKDEPRQLAFFTAYIITDTIRTIRTTYRRTDAISFWSSRNLGNHTPSCSLASSPA